MHFYTYFRCRRGQRSLSTSVTVDWMSLPWSLVTEMPIYIPRPFPEIFLLSDALAPGFDRCRGSGRPGLGRQPDSERGTGHPAGGEPRPPPTLPAARGRLFLWHHERNSPGGEGIFGARLPERYLIQNIMSPFHQSIKSYIQNKPTYNVVFDSFVARSLSSRSVLFNFPAQPGRRLDHLL